ncbi:DUF488 domain-containing protein [Hyphomonas pacifica]|uniref:DUF488 domain-containing protein n=1 Tax=Hyphomonas pacifica TaxID=1280941 RepID=UPI000DBFCB04|nr:DUF488 domain-containing protein [Hyphomonas pacifica]RAN36494.1 hypothetical protein HY11_01870 [Hyphomonas pacifica]
MLPIFSVGHSNHSWEDFLHLLQQHQITAVVDVRSSPVSKYPHFTQKNIKWELHTSGIAYVFLGKELGGRPNELKYFSGTKADYEKMARSAEYSTGIDRLTTGARKYSIAMMCSEHNPFDCHRCLLVGRTLLEIGIDTQHILSTGELLSQRQAERDLMKMANAETLDMFASADQKKADAYRARALKIAYDSSSDSGSEQ